MASNHTQHYGLCQWEATDAVLRTDFNEDNQKIDTALKNQAGSISSLSSQMANKASTGTVNSLSTTVSQKADRSELKVEVSARVQADNAEKAAREAADAANMATLRGENCWVKLKEWSLSSPTTQMELDFSDVSRTLYRQLRLHFQVGLADKVTALIIHVDHITGHFYRVAYNSPGTGIYVCNSCEEFSSGVLDFYPTFGSSTPLVGTVWSVGDYVHEVGLEPFAVDGTSWNSMSSVQFSADGVQLLAGAEFALYALKK